jgi:hypothetical protein
MKKERIGITVMKKLFWILPIVVSVVFTFLFFFRKRFSKPVVYFDGWEVL